MNIAQEVQSWKDQGLALLPRYEPELLRTQLSAVGIAASADLLFLYSQCGGMQQGTEDKNWFELWPVETCIREVMNFPSPFLAFAGGFLAAHVYCVRPNDEQTCSVFIDHGQRVHAPQLVASSLEQAFWYLLNEPQRLHLP